jgi:hypothetical protein
MYQLRSAHCPADRAAVVLKEVKSVDDRDAEFCDAQCGLPLATDKRQPD